jgi:hypothetical protein
VTVYEPIRARLLASGAIAALVGARVYPLRLPQKPTFPAIVLLRVSGIRATHLHGAASLARPRVQVDCWAPTLDQAAALGALCRQQLENYSGPYTDTESPATTITVQTVFDEEHDLFDEDINGGTCRHSADYFVFHSTAGGTV